MQLFQFHSQKDHQEQTCSSTSSSELPLEGEGSIISQVSNRIRLEKQEMVKRAENMNVKKRN